MPRTRLVVFCLVAAACSPAAVIGGEQLADPTRPSWLPEPKTEVDAPRAPSWRVESIIVSPGRRLAVINGRLVGENERIGAARVVEILPYEVRLEYQGEIRSISLVPTRVKRPTNEVVTK